MSLFVFVTVLPIERLRKIDPELEKLSDKEMKELRDTLYAFTKRVLDEFFDATIET